MSEAEHWAVQGALADNDLEAFARVAVPLCENSILLFACLFMGQDLPPHIASRWNEVDEHNKVLIRLARQTAKTTIWTNALMAQRVCYATVPGSVHNDAKVLALFETRDRAVERMRPIRKLLGDNALINAVFRGAEGTKWEGMSIAQMASQGGAWSDFTIDVPHPLGQFRADPTIRALAPGMATVGFSPTVILMDDLVGTKTADSPKKTENLRRWVTQDVLPMAKAYTKVLVPHTVFQTEDLNRQLEKTKTFYLLQVPALNRMPSRLDYEPIYKGDTVVDIKLTGTGRGLQSCWPCPGGDEDACPAFDEDHFKNKRSPIYAGYHRPLKDLLLQYETDPVAFALQYMHKIVASDLASVKRWVMRFHTTNPDDPRIGKVAPYHKEWSEWAEKFPEARIPKDPPRVHYLAPDGKVYDERGGQPISTVEDCAQAWDLAIGRKTRNDYTVCATLYRTNLKTFYAKFRRGKWRHDTVWRMIGSFALTNPIRRPREVGVEVNNFSEVYKEEGAKAMREMGLHDSVRVTEVRRTKDKDRTFAESGLPVAMMNGLVSFDLADEEAILEILSVMPDQSGAHDDCLDALVNCYPLIRAASGLTPGFLGKPI
jgi:phage terminase large subunit-like protein